MAIAEYRAALERVPTPDLYGAGFVLEYGWARALRAQHRWKEAKTHWLNALRRPTRRPTLLPWAYFRLVEIAKREGDLRGLRQAAQAAISADAAVNFSDGMLAEVKALDPTGPWSTAAARAQQ